MDKLFRVETLRCTPNPQQITYAALHQDYCSDFVWESRNKWPSEEECGEIIIRRLLAGGRNHFGPLEHCQITLACGYFNHSTVMQLRTHRIGVTFDVQSYRYTSKQIIEAAEGSRNLEEVFYLRPVGTYTDRQGKHYEYTDDLRNSDLNYCLESANWYKYKINQGLSEEHARDCLPVNLRQHFVLSANARSLMHLLDTRLKRDAQIEVQWFSELLLKNFSEWMPAVSDFYKNYRAYKGRLAP